MFNLSPTVLISRVLTLIIAFTIHEFAHAFVADRFGDPTPQVNGRLTLNPLKHLDILGSLMLLTVGFGWAKPVPVNPYLLRSRSSSALMWVSLSGPASNLLLAILAGILLRTRLIPWTASSSFLPSLAEFLFTFLSINLLLLLFNLIPLAPLDGEKIAEFLLPQPIAQKFSRFQQYGPIVLMVLLFIGPMIGFDLIGWIITPALTGLQKVILGV